MPRVGDCLPVGIRTRAGLKGCNASASLHYGLLSSILPGVTNTGNASLSAGFYSEDFPNPGGGGLAAPNQVWLGPVATFSRRVTQFGLTAAKMGRSISPPGAPTAA